jgi:glycogen debranching enzyme
VLEDRVILKQNDVFIVSDLTGDIPAGNDAGLGLYRADTRFLSTYELRLNGRKPVLLNQGVDRAYVATFQLTNPVLDAPTGGIGIPRQSLSLRRTRFVHDGFHERIGLQNCNPFPVKVQVQLRFDADFLDIFEVRGHRPEHELGLAEPVVRTETGFRFGYRGLDAVRRTTEVVFHPVPDLPGKGTACLTVELDPHGTFVLLVDILPLLGEDAQPEAEFHFDAALTALERRYQAWNDACTRFRSDNEVLDSGLLWRNLEDLRVLCDERPTGLFPTAGVPWYAVPFGRDALITSIQTLALNPELAVGSLRFLARHQGARVDEYREEEPGKILHEMRFGELANLGQIPHTPYYGTVDATPLFLVTLAEVLRWTGDLDLLTELLPHVLAALEWIDRYGDKDRDGFVEYGHRSGQEPIFRYRYGDQVVRPSRGLVVVNQGWKDSLDSLVEQLGDGWQYAPLPAALVEVQGYVYQAKSGLASIFRRLGRRAEADRLQSEAEVLRERFEERFWMPEASYYAQALDRDKRQVTSITSNPGHCLWSGIVDPGRARALVRRLMASDMYSGWGIRTLSTTGVSYNPMSYHNGSIWPHDNSIIARGMRRYGFREEAELVVRSVLEACMRFADHRIPELFCGFARDRRFHAGPGEYLVSCSPQAWGAGSLFHFLQILLGVEADVLDRRIRIDPLPTPLYRRLRVEGMRIGDGELDFTVETEPGIRVRVDRRPAGMQVEVPA